MNKPRVFAAALMLLFLTGYTLCWAHAMVIESNPREGAVLFSALTTVVSFGSLAFSEHHGLSGMGLLLTIALSSAVLCTLVILPSIMSAVEDKR